MTQLAECTFRKQDGWRSRPGTDHEYSNYDVSWIFVLEGPEGAITFDVSRTPPGTELNKIFSDYPQAHPADEAGGRWFGWDLGVHSRTEVSYASREEECYAIGSCWYDGTGLGAETLLKKWMAAGMDNQVVVDELWKWYHYRFLGKGEPDEAESDEGEP